jgi:hypothetical protein
MLKIGLSIDTTFNPPLFLLDYTVPLKLCQFKESASGKLTEVKVGISR